MTSQACTCGQHCSPFSEPSPTLNRFADDEAPTVRRRGRSGSGSKEDNVKDQINNSEVERTIRRTIISACASTVVACLLFLAASEEASAASSIDPDNAL